MKKIILQRIAFAALGLCLLAAPAHATEKTDVSVGLKTLPVLSKKIRGEATMAVVYDAASKADAEGIKAAIDGGLKVPGGLKLTVELVDAKQLSKLSNAKIAFLADGLDSSHFASVASAAASNGILTISTDLNCVKSSKCILGVASKPSIQIIYNKQAADAASISFLPAFTMLAKQI